MAQGFIPPGGFVGASQQTQAAQMVLLGSKAGSGVSRRRRRRKSVKRSKKPSKSSRRSTSRGAKFVKGSAAAKRYMAKLRRMRKRK